MGIKITDYNAICNLGNDINEVFLNAINGNNSRFEIKNDVIKGKNCRLGIINSDLPEIKDENYNIRCNKLLLKCLEKIDIENLFKKYDKKDIGIVIATTNTGVQEYEYSKNIEHTKISNPSDFIKDYYDLKGYHASVSTACSSGIKAFSIAKDLLNSNIMRAVIVGATDAISKVPVYGFDSLEILSQSQSLPLSKNRCGMNIAEGCAVFILEKNEEQGIEILSIGESTDYYHSTTPDPDGIEAVRAIQKALDEANINPNDIDYINLHGTGTIANDIMETNAISKIFSTNVPCSSTKALTGHCLGAASGVEIALCAKLIEEKCLTPYPHIFDNQYDDSLKKIKLVQKGEKTAKMKNVLCTSFGFGGTNAAIILGAKE